LLRKVRSLLFRGEGVMYEEDGFPLTTRGETKKGEPAGMTKEGKWHSSFRWSQVQRLVAMMEKSG
jgi:hypothetical protein